jgi:hypothetical protein
MVDEVIAPNIYYKGTLASGVAKHDGRFVYNLGMNTHPNPDRKSTNACGCGLHLWKTLEKAIFEGYPEIYEARAGVILGEDEQKVRCANVFLIRRITDDEITAINKETENKRIEAIKQKEAADYYRKLDLPYNCFVDHDWIKKSLATFSQSDYEKLGIEITTPKRKVTITTKLPAKDRRQILEAIKV